MTSTAHSGCVLLDTGVDWITATCNDPFRRDRLEFRASHWLRQEASRGVEISSWRQFGFDGLCCGSVQFGVKEDSAIARLGGVMAWQHWRELYTLTTNVSRIDLQATIRHDSQSTSTISAHYKASMRARKQGQIRRAVDLYRSSDGSATIYFGKRQSERFGRIYEKGKESKLDHYANAVRYEVEYKERQAPAIARALASVASEKALVLELVSGYFREARSWSSCIQSGQSTTVDAAPRANRQTSLEWLRSQVAPAVARLVDQGHVNEVVQALGLSAFVTVDNRSSVEREPSRRRIA